MSFSLDLENFARKTNKRADAVVRKIVLDVGTALVLKSPVGDPVHWKVHTAPSGYVGGRFRANWQYGNNVKPSGVKNTIDPTGANTISGFVGQVEIEAAGKLHYLVNNLPYSIKLENGYSQQAPQGMVALTVLQFQPICKAAAEAIRARI